MDTHAAAGITGAPVVFDGRMYVPVQGIGEEGMGANNKYECCTFRGNVTALDANTGKAVWKTYTIDENKPRGKTKDGVQSYGPPAAASGRRRRSMSKRKLLYVATGNGYADPPQKMTNAIVAMDLATGAVKWVNQVLPKRRVGDGLQGEESRTIRCAPRRWARTTISPPRPALIHAKSGKDYIVVPQKSGTAHALDPDNNGKTIWTYQFGKGSGLGGQWGTTSDGETVYFGTADLLTPTPGGMMALKRSRTARVLWKQGPEKKLCGDAPRLQCRAGRSADLHSRRRARTARWMAAVRRLLARRTAR